MRAIIAITIPGTIATWWFVLSVLPQWIEAYDYKRCMARDGTNHYVHQELWGDVKCYAWRSDAWSVSAL